jgi:phage N-6-adenine-methyltransferase
MPGRNDYGTPWPIYRWLDQLYQFEVDVAANLENAKCSQFWSALEDGLKQTWASRRCFLNPPFSGDGHNIGDWLKKAYEESVAGALVVSLLPVRSAARWFQEWIALSTEIWLLTPRIRFEGAKGTPHWDSMVVVYEPHPQHHVLKFVDWRKAVEEGDGFDTTTKPTDRPVVPTGPQPDDISPL